jgi:hypothetical protein
MFDNVLRSSSGVVVITRASHARGPRFDPELEQKYFKF